MEEQQKTNKNFYFLDTINIVYFGEQKRERAG